MGVFTFVCRSSGDQWTARQLSGDLEASASSTYDLQRRLVQAALAADSSGGVQTSFSMVTPTSAVFQVVIGGAGGGGATAAGAAPVGNAAEPEAPSELKKEEEQSDDDYMGISLFD